MWDIAHHEAEPGVDLTDLSVTTGGAMLRTVAESVQQITGADYAVVVHRVTEPAGVEVIAASGAGAPPPGTRMSAPVAAPPRRIALPLSIDGSTIGSIVAEGVTRPLSPQTQRELSLLAAVAALTLNNRMIALGAERRAAVQLQRQYRLLTGTIFHLRNTIAVVSESMALLPLHGPLTDDQRTYVDRTNRSVGSALRLLNELDELGRADAGELVPNLEPVQPATLLRDVLRDHRQAASESGITFHIDAKDLPQVTTDAMRVRQILENLVSNAIRYSPPHGRVTVRARLRQGRRASDPATWLRIDVVDQGPGVTEAQGVFEEVERVAREAAPGLRLVISRRTARVLGGDLTLQTRPGEGSTFSLWLPITASAAAAG